jgi:protein-S-isoprenylcysteine O-methyltransferase Ste14
MSSEPAPSAVRIPPPVIFLGGFVAAWFLNRLLEFTIDGAGAGWVQIGLGGLLVAAGLALVVSAGTTMTRAGTTVLPHRQATRLVTGGPFRFTRNPIYLGLTAVYLGVAALANAAWPLVLLPGVLAALTVLVIHHEERGLRAAFGPDYDEYCRHVRRWL